MSKYLTLKSYEKYAVEKFPKKNAGVQLSICDYRTSFVTNIDGKLKFGLVDRRGRVLVPPVFDHIDNWCNRVRVKDKFGIIKDNGEFLIPPIYDFIQKVTLCKRLNNVMVKHIFFEVQLKKKYGLINAKGDVVIKPIYDSLVVAHNYGHLILVQKNKKWGFINTNGQTIIPLKFDYAESFYDNHYSIVGKNNKYGVISKRGRYLVPPKFQSIWEMQSGYFQVKNKKKMGLVNIYGKIIIPIIYDWINVWGKYFIVRKNNKYGLIDIRFKKEILPLVYDDISQTDVYDKFKIEKNGKIWIGKRDGKGFKMEEIERNELLKIYYKEKCREERLFEVLKRKLNKLFSNLEFERTIDKKYYIIKTNKHKKGLVKRNGEIILKAEYDWIEVSFDNIIASKFKKYLKDQSKCVLLTKNLSRKKYYDFCNSHSEYLTYVERNGKSGFVDYKGREVFGEYYHYNLYK